MGISSGYLKEPRDISMQHNTFSNPLNRVSSNVSGLTRNQAAHRFNPRGFLRLVSIGIALNTSASCQALIQPALKCMRAPQKIRSLFAPLDGSPWTEQLAQRQTGLLKRYQGIQKTISTTDKEKLNALWFPRNLGGPTVILFNGKGKLLSDLVEARMAWYLERDFNVLHITPRGYPGSTGSLVQAGEMGFIYDAQASLKTAVKELGIPLDKILVHGFSLGGVFASYTGQMAPVALTLDHTFKSAQAMGERKLQSKLALLPAWLIAPLAKALAKSAFASGESIPLDALPSTQPGHSDTIKSNGLNISENASQCRGQIFVISGQSDQQTPPVFGKEIIEARYPQSPVLQSKYYSICKGDHHYPFFEDKDTVTKYEDFLKDQHLLIG